MENKTNNKFEEAKQVVKTSFSSIQEYFELNQDKETLTSFIQTQQNLIIEQIEILENEIENLKYYGPINYMWWNNLAEEWKEIFFMNIELNRIDGFFEEFKLSKPKSELFYSITGHYHSYNIDNYDIKKILNDIWNLDSIYIFDKNYDIDPMFGHPEYSESLEDIKPLSALTNIKKLIVDDYINIEKLSNLENIEELHLRGCPNLNGLEKLKNIEVLENQNNGGYRGNANIPLDNIKNLTKLKELTLLNNESDLTPISHLIELTYLNLAGNTCELDCLEHLINLKELILTDNQNSLDKIVNCKKLEYLDLENNTADISPVFELQNLKGLNLSNNKQSLERITNLIDLETLNIEFNKTNISQIVNLPRLSKVFFFGIKQTNENMLIASQLKQNNVIVENVPLNIEWWNSLDEYWRHIFSINIEYFEENSNYEESKFKRFVKERNGFDNFDDFITSLRNLKSLIAFGRAEFEEIPYCNYYEIKSLNSIKYLTNIEHLYVIDYNPTINKLSCLEYLTNLKKITLYKNKASLLPLKNLKNLNEVYLLYNEADISPLMKLGNLKKLTLYYNRSSLNPISNLTEIDELLISEIGEIDCIMLKGLTRIDKLTLSSYRIKLVNADILSSLMSLSHLVLNARNLDTLEIISPLINLRSLEITDNELDLSPISSLTDLEELNLTDNKSDLEPISNLTKLKKINLSRNNLDLSPIGKLSNLEDLDLSQNSSSLTPVGNLIKLRRLNLYANKTSDFTPIRNLTNLEYLNVQYISKDKLSSIKEFISELEENGCEIMDKSITYNI